jgi:glycosyltransferase involved in cell wall biosynthesis
VSPVRPRRLAVLKPDFGVTGGFERVVDRIESGLRRDGHDVTRLTVPVNELPHAPYGLAVPDAVWAKVPEYFRYLASIEAFEALDTRRFDAVVSTQPPSFANRHPRHLAVFFHHHRIFYDLEVAYLAAGFALDPEVHRQAAVRVRDLDRPLLAGVRWFLAGSESVRARLARFNQIDRVGLFHAGIGSAAAPGPIDDRPAGRGAVLCVGRHEFPKRTELFIQAMKHLPDRPAVSVGTGGREAWARALDHRLSQPGADIDGLTDAELWCNTGQGAPAVPDRYDSNVTFLGWVVDDELGRLYHDAPCVVAPAFEEDYGLTAVEAMAHGTPVVVCDDGGGLATLVDHEVDGLVVEPTGKAIAAAVERLCDDPDLRAELAAGARAKAAATTWSRADDQLRAGLAEVLE